MEYQPDDVPSVTWTCVPSDGTEDLGTSGLRVKIVPEACVSAPWDRRDRSERSRPG